MKHRRFAGMVAAAVATFSLAVVAGLAVAPGAVAAPSGSLTQAAGICTSKVGADYGQVAVTGTFTGLTPNTSYQLELDETIQTHTSGRTDPVMSSGDGVISFDAAAVRAPFTLFKVGPAAVTVLPTNSGGGGETATGTVTVTDGVCVSHPTQLHATPSFASLQPWHLYAFQLTATLTADGVPLPGRSVSFVAGGSALCSPSDVSDGVFTDANGVATCNARTPFPRLLALLRAGGTYTATFAGDPGEGGYTASSATARPFG